MPRKKPKQEINRTFHQFTFEEKELITQLRMRAIEILQQLEKVGLQAFLHGSTCRGDVTPTSDIDIFIPILISSFKLDMLPEFTGADRRIVMGTPHSMIRGLFTQGKMSVSFPLSPPRERMLEFYRFSGLLYEKELSQGDFTPGVTKQLWLIEPDPSNDGYWVSSLEEDLKRTQRILKVTPRIIEERRRVLSRRNRIGRTGLLLDYALKPEENFEQALKAIAARNPIVRRALKA